MQIALLVSSIVADVLLAALVLAASVSGYFFYRLYSKLHRTVTDLSESVEAMKSSKALFTDIQEIQTASKNALNVLAEIVGKLAGAVVDFKAQLFQSGSKDYEAPDDATRGQIAEIEELVSKGIDREEARERVETSQMYKDLTWNVR